jgi:hypothetical protein
VKKLTTHLLVPSVDINSEWSYTSKLPTLLHGVYRVNLTLKNQTVVPVHVTKGIKRNEWTRVVNLTHRFLKEPPAHTGQQAGCASGPVWAISEKRKSLPPTGI